MSAALVKAYILTHGVQFTDSSIEHAKSVNAKGQNLVYNAPRSSRSSFRPQELLLTDPDGYTICASAVAPVPGREPACVTYSEERLSVATPGLPHLTFDLRGISFVPRPRYYDAPSRSGRPMTEVVSACGLDELNIWPWHDCAISTPCSFCGINKVALGASPPQNSFQSLRARSAPSALEAWAGQEEEYLGELTGAVMLAMDEECYDEHLHFILISGNLADDQLDDQARIYARIARAMKGAPKSDRFNEGVVAVTAPPRELGLLREMQESGVDIVVFNLEAFTAAAFQHHCPGKANIGRDHYLRALEEAVGVFGWGASWSNFVLGLESAEELLRGCEELADLGIVPGANVLHLDLGGSTSLEPPDFDTVVGFYRSLAEVYRRHDLRPYYCAKALRTSLSNEAFAGRLG